MKKISLALLMKTLSNDAPRYLSAEDKIELKEARELLERSSRGKPQSIDRVALKTQLKKISAEGRATVASAVRLVVPDLSPASSSARARVFLETLSQTEQEALGSIICDGSSSSAVVVAVERKEDNRQPLSSVIKALRNIYDGSGFVIRDGRGAQRHAILLDPMLFLCSFLCEESLPGCRNYFYTSMGEHRLGESSDDRIGVDHDPADFKFLTVQLAFYREQLAPDLLQQWKPVDDAWVRFERAVDATAQLYEKIWKKRDLDVPSDTNYRGDRTPELLYVTDYLKDRLQEHRATRSFATDANFQRSWREAAIKLNGLLATIKDNPSFLANERSLASLKAVAYQ
jgi:hypothetical protein